jgi:hypothetical protein
MTTGNAYAGRCVLGGDGVVVLGKSFANSRACACRRWCLHDGTRQRALIALAQVATSYDDLGRKRPAYSAGEGMLASST